MESTTEIPTIALTTTIVFIQYEQEKGFSPTLLVLRVLLSTFGHLFSCHRNARLTGELRGTSKVMVSAMCSVALCCVNGSKCVWLQYTYMKRDMYFEKRAKANGRII